MLESWQVTLAMKGVGKTAYESAGSTRRQEETGSHRTPMGERVDAGAGASLAAAGVVQHPSTHTDPNAHLNARRPFETRRLKGSLNCRRYAQFREASVLAREECLFA